MNIGFDLDKVFINHPPLIPTWLMSKLYGEKSNGHLSYRVPGKLEQSVRKLSHMPFLRQPIKGNMQIVQKLKEKKNVKLFLISSRFSFLKKETAALVKKYNLEKLFSKMDFNFMDKQPHLFKNTIIKKENIHRYVDDDLPLLQYLSKHNEKTLFFWLNNSRNDKLKDNIYAITDIASVFEKI